MPAHHGLPHALPWGPTAQAVTVPPPVTSRKATRWSLVTALLSLIVALVALSVTLAGGQRPMQGNTTSQSTSPPAYSDQQVADAKGNVCAAYALVHEAVAVNTNKQAPEGDNFAAQYAIAANSRLALYGGGGYLLDRLAAEPATPIELANAVKALAAKFREIAIEYLSERPQPRDHPLTDAMDGVAAPVDDLCK
jgi:hypothetical protein